MQTNRMQSMKIAIKAALMTAAWVALGPIHRFYMHPRHGFVLYDNVGAEEIKELEKTVKEKFKEISDHLKRAQDTMSTAIEDVRKEDTIYAKTADDLKKQGEATAKAQEDFRGLMEKLGARLQEVEQKMAKKPSGEETPEKTAGAIVSESDAYKAMIASREFKMAPVAISRKTIVNATLNTLQPLVNGQRVGGIIMPPQRRLTIRDLLPQLPTSSNLIEFCSELVFSNQAGPQGGNQSPSGGTEGEAKPESNITFQLSTAAVITLAHWIGASRQVLSDAAGLAGYIDTRLAYGLKLEEEDELLNSSGTAGELNGLRNQATAFNGGATNQSILDTLLKAFLQVSLAEYEASGVVMHPTDWTNAMLLKDTQGRYIFSDPQSMVEPRVWGKPVVPTASMTQGQFLTGAFDLACAIYDNETMNIRVSDQHSDFFTKNLVAILCEERLALVVYRAAALVTGSVSYAG